MSRSWPGPRSPTWPSPADPALGALLGICEPAEVLAAIKAGVLPGTGPGCGDSPASRRALEGALGRWRARLGWLPADADLAGAYRDGIRLVCPGDPEWPGGLDELGQARPYALWLRGQADLRLGLPALGVGGGVTGRQRVRRSTSPVSSPPTSAIEAGRSSQAEHMASTPPRTAARWPPGPSPSRSWPAASITRTRRGMQSCSNRSRRAAWWPANGRRAAIPPGCGSWSGTGLSPR